MESGDAGQTLTRSYLGNIYDTIEVRQCINVEGGGGCWTWGVSKKDFGNSWGNYELLRYFLSLPWGVVTLTRLRYGHAFLVG